MAKNYDDATATIKVTCANCGDEIDVDIRADVEVETYVTVKKD